MSLSLLTLFFFVLFLRRLPAIYAQPTPPAFATSLFPSDAVSLLSFKSASDLDNKLVYSLTERFDYCQWRGVKCAQGRVVRLVLDAVGLRGGLAPGSLSRLDRLRVLSLSNNSLSGPIPDLSSLANLKSLFLNANGFSGTFPLSILVLHQLKVLDLSFNNFTGPIPVQITGLGRLSSLKLEFNRFDGILPAFNQSFLVFLNVSGNNLTGEIPVTPTLSRFGAPSFWLNPGLCGETINRKCASRPPFFESPNATSSSEAPLGQSAQAQNGPVVLPPPAVVSPAKGKKGGGLVLGFTISVAVIIAFGIGLVAFSLAIKKQKKEEDVDNESNPKSTTTTAQTPSPNRQNVSISKMSFETQKHEDKILVREHNRGPMSGNLLFCGGKSGRAMYSMEQLMRASAELLGRGTMGTTYKAVLDNQLIVTVKRLDVTKTAATSGEAFEQHMDMVGGLKHVNLVPVRAFFQAKGERLVIYEYQPNGSLFNLIHGSRSSRSKPLHWTSCLKIAEDVAQGLSYIHQSSALIHGNLKSTNILLGPDFEARLTDCCLNILSDSSNPIEDSDASAYKAPETRKSSRGATSKSDVYSFGVFLFELMTGKHPSQHPFMAPQDMLDWVMATRGEDEGRLGMLTEVAWVCRVTSPEQRPAMWQVMKMIQEIKERAMAEDAGAYGYA